MERIWFKDIGGFITEKNIARFMPTKDMNFTEQLNAMLRFTIYFCAIVFILKQDINIVFIPIAMAVFTFFIYIVDDKNKKQDREVLEAMGLKLDRGNNKLCVKPTVNNPFMNVLMSEYSENPKRPPACSIAGSTKHAIKKNFDRNLYRDIDDIFHKNASDRQFYTMPSTTIPNDSMSYARWLYEMGSTCKEGNGTTCYANTYRPSIL